MKKIAFSSYWLGLIFQELDNQTKINRKAGMNKSWRIQFRKKGTSTRL